MNDRIVINTSPLIALGQMGLFELLRDLPIEMVTPTQVKQEIEAGARLGHPVGFPEWLDVRDLKFPVDRSLFDRLDSGEAAVIQLALEFNIDTVCIDEIKGRRIAKELGLSVTGSLGILGRFKRLGIVKEVKPYMQAATDSGIYYEGRVIRKFLREIGE